MLCLISKTKIDNAYNDLCFDCYREQKIEKVRANGSIRQSVVWFEKVGPKGSVLTRKLPQSIEPLTHGFLLT